MIDGLLLALAVIALLPAIVLFAQLLAATPARLKAATGMSEPTRSGRVAVVMPAHNEASGIRPAIAAVLSQLVAGDRLLVVADNCSDDTAAIARAAGAEVIERHDEHRRGKGYALDFGVRWLDADPPDMLAIVDADCIAAPGALGQLALQCQRSSRPVQALYLMEAPPGASAKARVAAFAWRVKNLVRPLGGLALGWPCQLMGTGMLFPWASIRGATLASGHLVEDMQLGLDLATAGAPPQFCPQALVTSSFPSDQTATASQRTRWEHGHFSMIAAVGPRLLWRALVRRDAALAAMTLDMMVPPLASLVLGLVVLALLDGVWLARGGAMLPLVVVLVALGLVTIAIMVAWRRFGRATVSLRDLVTLPGYVLAKVPMYARLFTRRQTEWIRTKRDDGGQ